MTAPAPDFRAELEFLVELYEELGGNWTPHGYTDNWNDALASARTALATPPPEPPTDEEIVAFLDTIDEEEASHLAMARAVLERWGQR
jgi:hypothetical protein